MKKYEEVDLEDFGKFIDNIDEEVKPVGRRLIQENTSCEEKISLMEEKLAKCMWSDANLLN